MDLEEYLDKYQNKSFKEEAFNEVDALIFASLSYPKYNKFITNDKKVIFSDKEMLNFLLNYKDETLSNRGKKYISLLSKVCVVNRYKGGKFGYFISKHDEVSSKQFQAITIIVGNLLFVSYCGTDSTAVGFKEDMNMAYLEVTAGEIEAEQYINKIKRNHPFKDLYVGGHSKGGRFALYASKKLTNKSRLKGIYTFDSPNFNESFYDEEFHNIEHLVHAYMPNESIVGRLINDAPRYKIVSSSNSLIMQHDTSSWIIKDNHIQYENEFTPRSTRIVEAFNHTLNKYDQETKKEFIDTLFDLLERLEIKEFTSLATLKESLPKLPVEWKKIPLEDRLVLFKILLTLAASFIKNKK